MLFSLTVHGRNDSYMGNFGWRLETVLNNMGANIASLPEPDCGEIVLCDWGSEHDKKLIDNLHLTKECADRLRYVYVPPDIAKKYDQDSQYSSSHAINTGVRQAGGEFVVVCDSDVYWREWTMKCLYEAMRAGKIYDYSFADTFFWAARHHVPRNYIRTCPNRADLNKFIETHQHQFVCDTPETGFGGAVCALTMTHKMYDECGGYNEKMIYWGVNDICLDRRLCMKYMRVVLNTYDFRFFHLEHYQTRQLQPGIGNPELTRKVNVWVEPTSINANGPNWGLAGVNLTQPASSMFKTITLPRFTHWPSVSTVFRHIVNNPNPPYDSRLAPAMDETEYIRYQDNPGHMYYLLLMKLVRYLKPKKVLELGTSIGRSALFMMMFLPEDSSLTTVDIGSHRRTDLAGFAFNNRLKIVFGDDLDQSVIDQIDDGFDFCYLDSEHNYEQIAAEWKIYAPKLKDGAIVAMDDIHLNVGMEKFWNDLPYEKVDTGDKFHFSGFGLFRYIR
jgi:predicted O-methyltransferase YrrM